MTQEDKFEKTMDEARDFVSKFSYNDQPKVAEIIPLTHEDYEPKDEDDEYDDVILPHDDEWTGSPEQLEAEAQWIKRENNYRHMEFIKEMIAHGNRRIAYQKVYPGVNDKTAKVNACKLLARPEIAKEIKAGLLAIKKQSLDVLKEQYDKKQAAIDEKRTILAQIMRGQFTVEKETTQNGKTKKIKQKPDLKDVLRAIIVDNKMEEEWIKAMTIPDRDI